MESNIILYTSDNGEVSIQVQYEDGTFWLTQKRIAELFGVNTNTINYHLKELYKSAELQEKRTIRKIRIVRFCIFYLWTYQIFVVSFVLKIQGELK